MFEKRFVKLAESDLEKNAEYSQAFGLNHDEEDPRLVAQRLLNIFRQLHIFTTHKRKEFNDDLLKQPLQVKKALAALPGGSLVLEYLNELEEKAGVKTDISLLKSSKENIQKEIQSVEEGHDEIAQVKILAKALSEAQGHPSNLAPDDVKKISQDLYDKFESLKRELENRIDSVKVISADGKTATLSSNNADIVKAISDAAHNIIQQQDKLSQIKQDFFSKFSDWASSNQNLLQTVASKTNVQKSSKNTADAVAPFSAFDFENFITQITEKQTEMFKEFSKQQADNLSNVLSSVLKENNSASIKVIEKALQSFQEESSRLLKIQENFNNSIAPSNSDNRKNPDHSQMSVSDDLKIANNLHLDNADSKIRSKKKDKKNKKKNIPEPNISFSDVSAPDMTDDHALDAAKKETFPNEDSLSAPDNSNDDSEYVWEYVDDNGDASADDNGDFMWEYVDDDNSENKENIAAKNNEHASEYKEELAEESSALESENKKDFTAENSEYVWEYVDDDNLDDVENIDAKNGEYISEDAEALDAENGEYVWEYVDENGNPVTDESEIEQKNIPLDNHQPNPLVSKHSENTPLQTLSMSDTSRGKKAILLADDDRHIFSKLKLHGLEKFSGVSSPYPKPVL